MALRIRRDSWQNDRQFDEMQAIASEIQRLTDKRVFIAENVTTTQKTGIVDPGHGRVVLDITLNKLCFYGTDDAWHTITSV